MSEEGTRVYVRVCRQSIRFASRCGDREIKSLYVRVLASRRRRRRYHPPCNMNGDAFQGPSPISFSCLFISSSTMGYKCQLRIQHKPFNQFNKVEKEETGRETHTSSSASSSSPSARPPSSPPPRPSSRPRCRAGRGRPPRRSGSRS